ncbi:MAG TPA: hypothetical protein VF527_22055 [Pyrinomonadaceae bacterium]|jgi:hypothetical protein
MKKIKFILALLAVFSALSFGIVIEPSSAAEEGFPKCTCLWPSGDYGIIENDDCVVKPCHLDFPDQLK